MIQGTISAFVWRGHGKAGKRSDIFVGMLDGTRYIGWLTGLQIYFQ
jgi:hypothetical protein